MNVYELAPRFQALFSGLPTAFGTGAGRWIKRPPAIADFVVHLSGQGPGIGIAPLRPDSTVLFAAIDLDEPDFDAARAMQEFIPGESFIERSRSGNAHVHVFFKEPIEAWVPMGILREACRAVGKEHVEVFPKNHDFSRVRLGSYLNLPYHGDKRPILAWNASGQEFTFKLEEFIDTAEAYRQEPEDWRKRARWLSLVPPSERERRNDFGDQSSLHMCADYIIEHAEDNPVVKGHRAVVFFSLAKMLTNWNQIDSDEAFALMQSVNDASPDRISELELRRILENAERGRYTSTGCDEPAMAPYVHPSCPIAKGLSG